MDLYGIETYLRPTTLTEVQHWGSDWAWLAGGTWLFGEPQPQLKTLVDMQELGWSELEATEAGLTIGATCVMRRLLQFDHPPQWTAVKALQSAVQELASFKVQNIATVAGNLCLALPAGTFAPVMVLLDAQYEILKPSGAAYQVPALAFQTGARQTLLQPGDVLRRIHIPATYLEWQVSYRRICVATAGIAIAIAVAAYNPITHQVRFGISGCVSAPRLIEFATIPTLEALNMALDQHIPLAHFLDDETASATYRRHVTQVLMGRSLQEALQPPA